MIQYSITVYSFVFYFFNVFELSELTEVCLHSGETFPESLAGRYLHIQVDALPLSLTTL